MIFHCDVLDISISDFLYHFHVVARGREDTVALSGEVLISCAATSCFSKNSEELLDPFLLFMWLLGC